MGSITVLIGQQKFETCPDWGAKLFECELPDLVVNGGAADMFAKWPELSKAASPKRATTSSWLAEIGACLGFCNNLLTVSAKACTFG